jgi:hypothetical protein
VYERTRQREREASNDKNKKKLGILDFSRIKGHLKTRRLTILLHYHSLSKFHGLHNMGI